MEELLSRDLESERLVVWQQRGDSIDVGFLDPVAEAVPDHGRAQLSPRRAAALRFPDDEFRANRRGFGMMRRVAHSVQLFESAQVTVGRRIAAQGPDRLA